VWEHTNAPAQKSAILAFLETRIGTELWATATRDQHEGWYRQYIRECDDEAIRSKEATKNRAKAARQEKAASKRRDQTSAAAKPLPAYNRTLVEYCCDAQSRIGHMARKGCQVIRLTEEDDVLS
jgi:hypothetical protein